MKSSRFSVAFAAGLAMLLAGCSATAAPPSGEGTGNGAYSARSEFSQQLHDSLPASIKASKTISVIGEANPPWRIAGEDGKTTGFQADMLQEFSKILGVDFKAESGEGLPAVKLGIQSGRYDIAFGPLLSNAATQKDLTFIDWLIQMPGYVYSSDHEQITSVMGLCGSTVAYLSGTAVFDPVFKGINQKCQQAGKPQLSTIQLADLSAILLAVKTNRATFAAMGAHQAAYSASQSGGSLKDYISSRDEYTPDANGMAFNPSSTELAKAMEGAWQEVFDNGVYADLMKKYNVEQLKADKPVLHLKNGS